MIPSVSDPGSSFRGALDYDFKPAKEPELLGGTMRAETPRGLAKEFGDWRALNEQVTKPVFHCSLSAAVTAVVVSTFLVTGPFEHRDRRGSSAPGTAATIATLSLPYNSALTRSSRSRQGGNL